jgi:regulator of protease activity HflC (stomatin/prohibitin superfamily)
MPIEPVSLIGIILQWALITLVVTWLLFSMIYIVRGKTAVVLETFGKPHRHAKLPGLKLKAPWPITAIRARVNLQLQEIEANVSVKTKDNAFMTLPVKVQYRASDNPEGAVKAHYELENPEQQITSYILNNVRQTASGMDMIALYANRDEMETKVAETLSERFQRFGFIIENVLVDEPQPSQEVRDAFNKVIASHRLKEAAENEAEAARIKLVGVAKAEQESKKLQGEGMAQMREAVAQGLKESMETMKAAGLSPEQSMEFLNETNRLDTITNAAAHGNMVIVDTRGGNSFVDTVGAVKAGTAQPRPVKAA